MNNRIRCLAVLTALTLCVPLLAQVPGPDLPKLSNLTFGWVSMSGVDPTLDMLTSFAPNAMALRDAGYHRGGEGVIGQLTFGDFKVDANFQSAITAAGSGILRIARYDYASNRAQIQGMPGMPAQTSGQAIELSYARHVGPVTLGVSVVPQDDSDIALEMMGTDVITGTSRTDYGGRVGAVLRLNQDVRVGANYSYQKDSGVIRLHPLLTGAAEWVENRDTFITRCGTIGASARVAPRTTVYAAHQGILATGESLGRRSAGLLWYGVTQELTDNLAVRANYIDGGQNYSVQWRSPVGLVNVAYTRKALMNAREMLGTGDAAFVALALAF